MRQRSRTRLPRVHAGSNLLPVLFERMIARDFAPKGYARQVLKDLEMLHTAAKAQHLAMPMAGQALTLFRMLVGQGRSEFDAAASADPATGGRRPTRRDEPWVTARVGCRELYSARCWAGLRRRGCNARSPPGKMIWRATRGARCFRAGLPAVLPVWPQREGKDVQKASPPELSHPLPRPAPSRDRGGAPASRICSTT